MSPRSNARSNRVAGVGVGAVAHDQQLGIEGRDPFSFFELGTSDYAPMAQCIAALGLPTLIVMEGGYAVDALGANVAEFLRGF